MDKNTVRVSFYVPIEEHILYKTECVKSRIRIKDFMHNLIVLGMKEYKKAKFHDELSKSMRQAKKGKVRTVSSKELNPGC